MQKSLCQLTMASLLALCLLLRAVHGAPAGGAPHGVAYRNSPPQSIDDMLLPFLTPEERLKDLLYDNVLAEMERSRRSGPPVDTFEPVSFGVLRRLMRTRLANQLAEDRQNRVDSNGEHFKTIGRR